VPLDQLVENYDDPVYSAAERLIDPDRRQDRLLRASRQTAAVAAAVASSPVASRTATSTSPTPAIEASRQNAHRRCDI